MVYISCAEKAAVSRGSLRHRPSPQNGFASHRGLGSVPPMLLVLSWTVNLFKDSAIVLITWCCVDIRVYGIWTYAFFLDSTAVKEYGTLGSFVSNSPRVTDSFLLKQCPKHSWTSIHQTQPKNPEIFIEVPPIHGESMPMLVFPHSACILVVNHNRSALIRNTFSSVPTSGNIRSSERWGYASCGRLQQFSGSDHPMDMIYMVFVVFRPQNTLCEAI